MKKLIFLLLLFGLYLYHQGYCLQVTPSLVRGVYRTSEKSPERGDVVGFCASGAAALLAQERDYLPAGQCDNGLRPLMKYLAAVPGDSITVDANSLTCGPAEGPLCRWSIKTQQTDSQGRDLPASLSSGLVPDGQALVLTGHLGSFDSRYFGFVPMDSLTVYVPVLTFEPEGVVLWTQNF